MDIYFVDENDNELVSFFNVSVNLTKGDVVSLCVRNMNKEVWNVEEISSKFEVLSIKHKFEKSYPFNGSVASVSQYTISWIKVREVKK